MNRNPNTPTQHSPPRGGGTHKNDTPQQGRGDAPAQQQTPAKPTTQPRPQPTEQTTTPGMTHHHRGGQAPTPQAPPRGGQRTSAARPTTRGATNQRSTPHHGGGAHTDTARPTMRGARTNTARPTKRETTNQRSTRHHGGGTHQHSTPNHDGAAHQQGTHAGQAINTTTTATQPPTTPTRKSRLYVGEDNTSKKECFSNALRHTLVVLEIH